MAMERPASSTNAIAADWDDLWESDVTLVEPTAAESLGDIVPLRDGEWPGDSFRVPADLAYGTLVRRQIQSMATEQSMSPDDTADLVLAASEAFNNAVRHGTSRPFDTIACEVHFAEGKATIELRYLGEPFVAGTPELPPTGSPNGRGRYIMAMLLDEVQYQFASPWTTVRLAKNYRRSPAPPVLAGEQ
jgi:anti-sigma regulatory factor (Ser/Thr protein kinase)